MRRAAGEPQEARDKTAQEIWKLAVDQQWAIGLGGAVAVVPGRPHRHRQAGERARAHLRLAALPHAMERASGAVVFPVAATVRLRGMARPVMPRHRRETSRRGRSQTGDRWVGRQGFEAGASLAAKVALRTRRALPNAGENADASDTEGSIAPPAPAGHGRGRCGSGRRRRRFRPGEPRRAAEGDDDRGRVRDRGRCREGRAGRRVPVLHP